jgi:hypothetical protein
LRNSGTVIDQERYGRAGERQCPAVKNARPLHCLFPISVASPTIFIISAASHVELSPLFLGAPRAVASLCHPTRLVAMLVEQHEG